MIALDTPSSIAIQDVAFFAMISLGVIALCWSSARMGRWPWEERNRDQEKAAAELLAAVDMILNENDNPANAGPWLPAKWRRPLVKAANNCHAYAKKK